MIGVAPLAPLAPRCHSAIGTHYLVISGLTTCLLLLLPELLNKMRYSNRRAKQPLGWQTINWSTQSELSVCHVQVDLALRREEKARAPGLKATPKKKKHRANPVPWLWSPS